MTPTGQTSEIIRKQYPTREYAITDDAATTAVIETAGLGALWAQCPSASLGAVEVLGSINKDGTFAEPQIAEPVTTFGDSAGPIAFYEYHGLPYLKIVADSGSHTILVGGSG